MRDRRPEEAQRQDSRLLRLWARTRQRRERGAEHPRARAEPSGRADRWIARRTEKPLPRAVAQGGELSPMAITRGNVTASSYGEAFAEPAATNGDLLVANVTWFSGAATPSISGWTLVSGSVVHNGSGSNPVGCALFTKIKGSGSSGPHSVGGGVSDYLVVCQAWSGVRASDPIAPVTGNGNQSDPYQIPLDSLTVGEDGSVEVLFSSSWTFPIDLPAGFTEWLQHSFEILYCGRSVDAGPTGALTVGRGFAADSGTTLRYIVRPASDGPEPDELDADDLTAGPPTLGTPGLTQAHALSASPLAGGAPSLGAPALGQFHAIAASVLTSGAPVLGTPSLAESHALTAASLATQAPVLGTPAVSQGHTLSAAPLAGAAPSLGSPGIGQGHALAVASLTAPAPVLGSALLAQEHALAADGLTGAPP